MPGRLGAKKERGNPDTATSSAMDRVAGIKKRIDHICEDETPSMAECQSLLQDLQAIPMTLDILRVRTTAQKKKKRRKTKEGRKRKKIKKGKKKRKKERKKEK